MQEGRGRPVAQRPREDVGRVGPEVGPHVVGRRPVGELVDVVAQLPGLVAPGEVRVALREADLGQLGHDLRARERLGQEDDVGVVAAGCARSATPRTPWAWCAGCRPGRCGCPGRSSSRRTSRQAVHSACPVGVALGPEVDRVDVLVLLGRVLGVADRCRRVGARTTPDARGPRDGRASTGGRSRAPPPARGPLASPQNRRKSSSVPSSGAMAVWPPSAEPMAQGLPGSSGPAPSVLFGPLRSVTPMGWIGGR